MIIENTEIDLNETLKSNYALSPSAVIGYQKDVERYTLPLFGIGQKRSLFYFYYERRIHLLNRKLIRNYAFFVQCGYKYLRQIFDKILF